MKKNIISFMLGGIVFLTIGASAAYVYTASDIGYQPQDENWEVTNASEALSSLKNDISNIQNLANQGHIVYNSGTLIVGLVSDNSPYVDIDGNYILAESTLGQSMIDDVTYKSIEAPNEIKGNVGAETVTSFNSGLSETLYNESFTPSVAYHSYGTKAGSYDFTAKEDGFVIVYGFNTNDSRSYPSSVTNANLIYSSTESNDAKKMLLASFKKGAALTVNWIDNRTSSSGSGSVPIVIRVFYYNNPNN